MSKGAPVKGPNNRDGFRRSAGLATVATLGAVTMWSNTALAEGGGMDMSRVMSGVVDSLVYTVLGILLLVISYKVFGAVVPFDLNKELAEDDNTAVGVFMAGIFIAVGLVISAAISG